MTVGIIQAFLRWILGVCVPGTGRRRRSTSPAAPAPVRMYGVPRAAAPWPPVQRSPYGLDVPLCGEESAVLRPYIVLAEREAEWEEERSRQRRRRLAAVFAADLGIDLDRHVAGAGAVAL